MQVLWLKDWECPAPKASIATISNAMDVGDPSNFIRIRHLYKDNFEELSKNISSYSFTDNETKEAMLKLYQDFTYVADPHGAVGYLGLKKYQVHIVVLVFGQPSPKNNFVLFGQGLVLGVNFIVP